MKQMKVKHGIFGGSFDPIHNGHLRTAEYILHEFSLLNIRFIPCWQQALKQQHYAGAEQRCEMLQLALQGYPAFSLDKREINAKQRNYAIDTVAQLQAEYPAIDWYWIMGMDSFLQLPQWHKWQQLIEKCKLIIIPRPGYQLEQASSILKQQLQRPSIFFSQAQQWDISATAVREACHRGESPNVWLPESVLQYIQTQRVY